MALLVYVDDLILTGNDHDLCASFKDYLHSCFLINNLGPLKYFLGIEVAPNGKGLFLCHRKYALEIVEECDLLITKPVEFSIETIFRLALATGPFLSDLAQYQWLVGWLIYLTINRLEFSYSIHILS